MKGIKLAVSWRAVLLGIGIGVVTMVCACAGAAALLARGVVGLDAMGLFAAGIVVAAGLASSLAAMLGGGEPVDAALAALGVLVVLFGINGVLCGGQMEGIAVTTLALAGGSGAAVFLRPGRGNNRKRRQRSRKKR